MGSGVSAVRSRSEEPDREAIVCKAGGGAELPFHPSHRAVILDNRRYRSVSDEKYTDVADKSSFVTRKNLKSHGKPST